MSEEDFDFQVEDDYEDDDYEENEYEDEDNEYEDNEDYDPFLEKQDDDPSLTNQPQLTLEESQEAKRDFHILPDKAASLESYIDFLSESISRGSISQTEFDSEILKTNYYLDLITKKYNIMSEEKQKIIEDARSLRKEAIDAYTIGAISEEKFNEVYTNAIRTEYSILKSSEIGEGEKGNTYDIDLSKDLTIIEKLEKLEKNEERQIKKIAKEHSIKFPKIPRGKTVSEVEKYYDNKILGKQQPIDLIIETYLSQYKEAKKIVDYYTTSFEVSKIVWNATLGTPRFEFKLVPSIRSDIEQIRREDNINQLLNPQEMASVNKLSELKSMMRKMSKEELIKCADIQIYELLTFIERLRTNKQYAFRFKTKPGLIDIEPQIESDNEVYGLPRDKFLIGYEYTRPNIYSIDSNTGTIQLNEVGNVGILALKNGRNPLSTIVKSETGTDPDVNVNVNTDEENLNLDDYDIIVPFQDELYSQLQTKDATYTDIVEVWEIHLNFINGSNKVLRYLSFEDFLLVFKRFLIKTTKDLRQVGEEELYNLLTKRSEIKYPRLKPRIAPFLLSQRKEKSYEEQRYEYYSNLSKKPEPANTGDSFVKNIELSEPMPVKKSIKKEEEGPDIKIFLDKIMQIEYYLLFKADKQKTLPTSQLSSKELLEDSDKIFKMREFGIAKLINYITETDPGTEELIKSIESDIFNFSSKNYEFNIKKVIFVFDNFPEKMKDVILGKSSIMELLVYETPDNVVTENFGVVKTDEDKKRKIDELLSWNPNTVNYDNYKDELESIEHDFKVFKKSHPELKSIQISQIMAEYGEKIQWNKSLVNYAKLEVPMGMIELNFRLRFLLRNRNRLPSRRIFKLATISNRVERQEQLERTFGVCKVKNYKKLSLHTERIIYSLSKTPEDYMYYIYVINGKFKLICQSLVLLEENSLISEYEMVSILIKFIINNGDFTEKDINRLNELTREITQENINLYIDYLEKFELKAQEAYRISQIDSDEITRKDLALYLDASRISQSDSEESARLQLIYLNENKYVPPVVYTSLPDDSSIKQYFIVNGQYICGGFYPPFKRLDENLVSHENYTREDLIQLAGFFSLSIKSEESNYEIYTKIKEIIREKKSTPRLEIKLDRIRTPDTDKFEYKTSDYLKIPIKSIMYVIRPRYLVAPPGEVYNVILDKTNLYGVPFKFNNGTPVYSSKLKSLVENKFIIIEGPSIYEDTLDCNFLKSNYYILIEYTDQRGVKIFFKEGVAEKKIIKKQPGYSACDRFKNKVECDDPNSYSLEIKGKKYKCKWEKIVPVTRSGVAPTGGRCVIFDDTTLFEDFADFDINKVVFLETYKQQNWEIAIQKSLKYIEDTIISEKLSMSDIELLKRKQKIKLYNYYKRLYNHVFPKEAGETKSTPVTEAVHDESIFSRFEDILKPSNLPTKKNTELQDGYTKFTIYKYKNTENVSDVDQVILDQTYNTYKDGIFLTIKPYSFNIEKNTYNCRLEDNRTIELRKEQIYKVDGNVLKVVPIFCLVKKEDFPFLENRKGYFWNYLEILSNRRYDQNGEPEIVSREIVSIRYDVPTNFIEPTENLNGYPVITREDIFEAMYKTAFDTLSNSVNQFVYTTTISFNATREAKKFAVINRIDIRKIVKIGIIGIEDIQKLTEVNYTINTITPQQILDIMSKAIEANDINTISTYYLVAVKAEIDKEILKSAKKIIDSYKKSGISELELESKLESKLESEVTEDVKPIKLLDKPVVSYVIQRGGKQREEVEE